MKHPMRSRFIALALFSSAACTGTIDIFGGTGGGIDGAAGGLDGTGGGIGGTGGGISGTGGGLYKYSNGKLVLRGTNTFPAAYSIAIGGANLAAQAIEAGLVDELRIFRSPVLVGGGTALLPPVTTSVPLELIETRTFASRVVYERYGRGTA